MNSLKYPWLTRIKQVLVGFSSILCFLSALNACPSPSSSFPISEDFETNALINWTQDPNNDFDWTVHTGSTTSSNTGPSGAYQGNYYIYTESTYPNNPNKIANLISPCFMVQSNHSTMISFAYHMFGTGQGSFGLDISTDDGTTWANLWTLAGNQGDLWETQQINLDAYIGQAVKLRFNVETNQYTSDVAIDDVTISATVTVINEICDDGIDNDLDGFVDNFDSDCPCSNDLYYGNCQVDCEYQPPVEANGFDLIKDWTSVEGVTNITQLMVGNMDEDEVSEIAVMRVIPYHASGINLIMFLDGSDGSLKYRPNTLRIHNRNKGMALADTDKDGRAEFFYVTADDEETGNSRKIVCYEYNPNGVNPEGSGTGSFDLQWISSTQVTCGLVGTELFATEDFTVSLADFNYDGTPEVYVGNEIYNASNGVKITDGGSNSIGSWNQGEFETSYHVMAVTVAIDVLPDNACPNCEGLELVAGNQVYSVDIGTGAMNVEKQAPNLLPDGNTAMVDYDLDGDLDAVITSNDALSSFLYIWDLQTETQIGNTHTINTTSSLFYHPANLPIIADFDGDNRPEIGVCGNLVFQVVEDYLTDISGTGGVLWSIVTTDNSGQTGASVFDFNGDGISEVVYRDEDNLRIISGPTGNNLATFECGSGTGGEYSIIADIDDDGETEILCNCSNDPGNSDIVSYVTAFKSNLYPWVPTRKLWNQYAYFNVNINDDLTVPRQQQLQHIVGEPNPGTSGPLNIFLKQISPIDVTGIEIFPAAELSLSADNSYNFCDLNVVEFDVTISNNGDVNVPNNLPITIYDGNPESTGATIIKTEYTSDILYKESQTTVTVTLNLSGVNSPIYLVVNDDGSVSTPFDLNIDFPVTNIGECDFSNNILEIDVALADIDVDIDYSGELCLEDDTFLTANATGGTPNYQYSWVGPNSFTAGTQSISIPESGNYYVTVTDANGCEGEFSAYVYESYVPLIFSLNTEVCEGESVTLSINSATAVQFNWGANAGNATTQSVTVTPSPPSTEYFVTVTNDVGCTAVASSTIDVIARPVVTITGADDICVGQTSSLTPNTGGTWVSTNSAVAVVTHSGVVTGMAPGTASFVFTNSTTQCVSLPTTPIQVKAIPTVSVSGPTSICEGFTTNLSPTTGGVWTSNDTNVATVTNSGVVTGVNSGSTTFVFTSNANGCASGATQPITVHDTPTIDVTGSTTLCIGSTTSLTPNSGGTWTSSDVTIATVSNTGLVTAIDEGNVTFTFTTTQGCVTDPTEVVTVDPNGNITIAGDDILCEGEITTLAASLAGGTWSSSNTALATINSSGVVTAIAAGNVTITYDHNSSSCAIDPTFPIQINDVPTISIIGGTSICEGENTQLSTSGSGGYWTSSDSDIAIISSTGSVVGINAGTVSFSYTSSNGCESDASGTITVDPAVEVDIDFNGSECLKVNSQLSAIVTGGTSGYTYSWTGPGGFSSGLQTVSISINGNYNLTVSDSKGCSSSTTAFIYEAYEPFIFTLNTEVCEGEQVSLSVNSTSAASYQWGANAGNSTEQSVTVTPGVPSTTYYVTVTNSVGCTTVANAEITVDPKPIVTITGSSSICENETTQLTPSTGGVWTSSDYSVATISNSGLVTGVSFGSATFTFRNNATGCFSDASAPVTVIDNGTIAITGDNQICVGETSTLIASVSGGTWSSSNIGVAQINNSGVITPVGQGSAIITYSTPTGSCYLDGIYEINIHSIPNLSINGPSSICENDQTFLSASTSGVWTSSDPSIASVSSTGVVTGISAGSATFSFESSVGCSEILGTPITIIGNPNVSLNGPGDICINATTSLLPNSGGVWISSNNSVATVSSSGIVTGISEGVASFTFIEITNGCISDNTISINVNADPTINGLDENNLCIGESTSITPSSGGTWESSNTAVASIDNNGNITAVGAGAATFAFTNSLTGCTSNASMPLTVNSPPNINFTGPTSICIGENTYIAPTTGGTWASTNVAIATIASNGEITGVSPGTVQFIFTSSSTGCTSNASEILTIEDPTEIEITGPSNICVDATTTLSPTTGGVWESSNSSIATVTNSGVVTGIAPGFVTFTFNSNAGCTSSPSTEITIDPKPIVTFIGPSSICIGTMTSLSPTIGGTWTSNNPTIATINNNGVVTGISAGSTTFTYVSFATGCAATTETLLNVYDGPDVTISGDDEICIGFTTSMLPSTGGTWTSSDNSIASISANGLVTGMNAGTVTFTFTEAQTGCISDASGPITVLPKPVVVITGDNQICAGETTTLSPTTGGIWTSNNESVATVTDQGVVTGLTQGLVRFTFISNEGCSSAETAPVIVFGKPSIVIDGSDLLCLNETGQMTASSSGTWASTNTAVATINNNGEFTGIAEGTVRFIFTDTSTGCSSAESDLITVNGNPEISIVGPSTICIGGTTNLFPTVDGIWISLDPSIATIQNNGVVQGVSAGSTRFIFTNIFSGCSSDTSAVITVDPGPSINFTGPTDICIGETTNISPSTGGTWMSTNTAVATIDNSGLITAVGQGSVKFRFTETSTGCGSELSETLTVNGPPTVVVAGSSTICIGAMTSLSPSTGGTWTSLQPGIATIDNSGNVTGVSSGIAHFAFVNSLTGCASDGDISVTVQDQIDVEITGESNICLGYTTTLSPNVGGFWTSSNPSIASVTNTGIVTARAPGIVTFEFTDATTGCASSGPTDPVTVELCTNSDFNVTLVDLAIQGNISTNDIMPAGTTYNGPFVTISKPTASLPVLTINPDGSYTFVSSVGGKYVYEVPVCIPPMTVGCPYTILEINVIDGIYSHPNPVGNLEFTTTYTNANPAQNGLPVDINTLANDDCVYTGGCSLNSGSVTVTDGPSNGTTTVSPSGIITYTPDPGFVGTDTIYYSVCFDGSTTDCSESTQVVTVNDITALNSTVAADDFTFTSRETPVNGNVMENDSDPEGDMIAVLPQGSPSSPIIIAAGSYYIAANGDYTFTPSESFTGGAEIIYTICDDASEPQCVQATLHILVVTDIAIKLRVYLEGALMLNDGAVASSSGLPLMRDDLRVSPFDGQNYIPGKDPYTYTIDQFVNTPSRFLKMGAGTMPKNTIISDSLAVFAVEGENAIVDWVHVELRSKDNYAVPLATRSGLVQRDGDIVDLDGVTDLRFDGLSVDSFYVVVKHRSHLGVMSMIVANDQLVDFTSPDFPTFNFGTTYDVISDYTGLSQKEDVAVGYTALWAGDFDSNGKVKFTNPSDDQNTLFIDVLFNSPDFLANYNSAIGYYTGDFDMNSKAKYTNPEDDLNYLFSQILFYPLNTAFFSNYNGLIEQIPPRN